MELIVEDVHGSIASTKVKLIEASMWKRLILLPRKHTEGPVDEVPIKVVEASMEACGLLRNIRMKKV